MPGCSFTSRPSTGELCRITVGRWQILCDLSGRLLDARRAIRPVPCSTQGGWAPPKCTLFGDREQVGPDALDESRAFWDRAAKDLSVGGVRLRRSERLCAIALAKRFAGPAFFAGRLGLSVEDLRFPDTATVAAHDWLRDARIDPDRVRRHFGGAWNGQWLHGDADDDPRPAEVAREIRQARKRLGAPPTYYAILTRDGDEMGAHLRGERAPFVEQVLHPRLRAYFEEMGASRAGLDSHRPVSPALHAAISEAVANFALNVVGPVVARHGGTLVYSGGDDALALLPTARALACALELRRAFSGDRSRNGGAPEGWYRVDGCRDLLMMGPTASASAGLAVVHHAEDLRDALDESRAAERQAKESGRDAIAVAVCRRSGEWSRATCAWSLVEEVLAWVQAFLDGASDRWAFHLRAEIPTLRALPEEAIASELARQLGRSDDTTRNLLPAERVVASWRRYRDDAVARGLAEADALGQFVALYY